MFDREIINKAMIPTRLSWRNTMTLSYHLSWMTSGVTKLDKPISGITSSLKWQSLDVTCDNNNNIIKLHTKLRHESWNSKIVHTQILDWHSISNLHSHSQSWLTLVNLATQPSKNPHMIKYHIVNFVSRDYIPASDWLTMRPPAVHWSRLSRPSSRTAVSQPENT
jgi:hypothetical protein